MPDDVGQIPENALWVRADVMKYLRIEDPRTLKSLEDDPTHPLPVHRIGGLLRYIPDEVDTWLRSRCSDPDAGQAA